MRISLHIWNEQCNSDSGQVLTLYLYCFTHHDYRICHLTAISNMPIYHPVEHQLLHNYRIGSESSRDHEELHRGVAASRFLGRQELVAYKVLVLTLGSMITIPMVWSM